MRCLLIEDYLPLRDSIRECLADEGFVVDESGSGDEGLWHARNHSYEVIVLDIMLPEIDGLTILRRLKQEHDKTPVILISARDAIEQRVEGLDAGADDYLVKPFDLKELVARVRVMVRRKFSIEAAEIEVGDLKIDCVRKCVHRAGREIFPTRLEFMMLKYLAHRAGEAVSRKEISEHVYQDYGDLASNKIDVCIAYLRRKLNEGGLPNMITTKRGHGFMLEEGGK